MAKELCRDTINCIVTGGNWAGECVTIRSLYRDRSRGWPLGELCHDTVFVS